MDADAQRAESADRWEAASSGWERNNTALRSFAAPVSAWLIQAANLQPGQRVLELAAGVAETGLMAAEVVSPGGSVLISDRSEGMLAAARRRAQELGVSNVEFRELQGEWIDLPVASVDAVLCRWGYMLMADPSAALAETRRVLRPGGRVALAVWDAPRLNPWMTVPVATAIDLGLVERPPEGEPGPFALADRDRVVELLADAGFGEIVVDAVDLEQRLASPEAYYEQTLDLSPTFHDAAMSLTEEQMARLREEIVARVAEYVDASGELVMPARNIVAAATA